MSKVRAISFLVILAFLITLSQSRPLNPVPQILKRLDNNTKAADQRSCTYVVDIVTSCSSARYTRDRIGIAFGDAYDNQIYIPRLDDPYSSAFESCSQDTFEITGPCIGQVCYLYVRRSGYDGWKPETITVSGYTTKSVTFNYGTWVPEDVWYGFNFCDRTSASTA